MEYVLNWGEASLSALSLPTYFPLMNYYVLLFVCPATPAKPRPDQGQQQIPGLFSTYFNLHLYTKDFNQSINPSLSIRSSRVIHHSKSLEIDLQFFLSLIPPLSLKQESLLVFLSIRYL